VHGPGAAGSTHLANFLLREAGLRCNLLVDPDGCRHAPWPPPPPATGGDKSGQAARPPLPSSLIYLYSDDPLLAAASFYRRGMAREQALKISGAAGLASAPRDFDPAPARAALALAAASEAAADGGGGRDGFPPTLDALLERGDKEDPFGFDAHLSAWLTRPAAAEVVFLRYERAFEPSVAHALFRRLLREARARRRPRWQRRAEEEDREDEAETEARADRLAQEWCAQRRQRRTQPSAEQRERGGRVFAASVARVAALPHGGCFVRPAAASSSAPEQWEALAS
jgi:hypothetical protein